MLFSFCQWLYGSSIGTAIRESVWVFPIIETIHVLSLTLLVGTVAIVDLRLLGLTFKREPVLQITRQILPLTWCGFAVSFASGFLLFWAEAAKSYSNPAFRLKLLLLILVGLEPAGVLYHDLSERWCLERGGNNTFSCKVSSHPVIDVVDRDQYYGLRHCLLSLMSLLPLFVWLSRTPLGLVMQQSTWEFTLVEMVHLVALAILGGVVLIVDLSLLGIGLRRQPVMNVARELTPLFLASLATMVITGVCLLSEEALKCYYSPAFRAKMAFLLLAIVFSYTIHRRVVRSSVAPGSSWKAKNRGPHFAFALVRRRARRQGHRLYLATYS